MFVCNVKFSSKSIVKFSLIVISIIVVIFFIISLYKILNSNFKVNDEVVEPDVAYLSTEEYTNVLKSVYENLDTYVGQRICFSGYVYRNLDFPENEFVLARDMIISPDFQSVIVGFLCEYDKSKDFSDNTWVSVTGKITKGDYHGDMPIIKVEKIETVGKPNDEYVYPPDESYIPTSGIV